MRRTGFGAILAALVHSAASAQTEFLLAPPVIYDLGFDAYPNSVDAGDLDRDGHLDLVLAARNTDGVALVFFGAPGATFGPPVQLPMGGQTGWAVLRDLDRDGDLDMAISHRQGLGRVSILAGDGAGGLGAAVDVAAGRTPTLIRSADLDLDGDLDLGVFNWGTADVTLLHNDGSARFTGAQTLRVSPTTQGAQAPVWAEAADLDGDGDVDLAVVPLNTLATVALLFNRGDGTFDPPVLEAVGGLVDDDVLAALASADLDGDGDVDLVTKAGGLDFVDRLIVLGNDGTGRFERVAEVPLSPALGGSPWDIASADLDLDGRADLAWASHVLSTQSAAFLRNEGRTPPSFALPEQRFFLDGFPRAVLPADLEGDGDTDIVVANIGSHTVAVIENLTVVQIAAGSQAHRATCSPPERDESASARDPSERTMPVPAPVLAPHHPPARIRGESALRTLADHGAPRGAPGTGRRTAAGPETCGDPDAGDCFEPHEGPGCADRTCCAIVCAEDPFCCEESWDPGCADTAEGLCEPPPVCPAKGSCHEPHDTSGCEDPSCCERVCLVDPFCCDGPWDRLCADEATGLCGRPPCTLPPCPAGVGVEAETDACFESLNDGCNRAEPAFGAIACGGAVCGTVWTRGRRDTDWYSITLEEPTLLTWTVNAEFPCEILIVSGACRQRYTVAASAHGGFCRGASARLAAEAGTYHLFVAPGIEPSGMYHGIGCIDSRGKRVDGGAFGGRYVAMASCGAMCPADLDLDGAVGIRDLLGLLGAWGSDPGGPPDLDGDGNVGAVDLGGLLASWGDCP